MVFLSLLGVSVDVDIEVGFGGVLVLNSGLEIVLSGIRQRVGAGELWEPSSR
jgi:hypothetical protein